MEPYNSQQRDLPNYTAPPPTEERRVALPLHRPVLIWLLLVVNIAVYALTWWESGGGDQFEFVRVLIKYGALYPPLVDEGEYWRLAAPMVLHGGLAHLLFNSYALYVLGPPVEEIYGSLRFLALYGLSGLGGTVASYGFSDPCVTSVGASGALFGLMGALGAFYWRSRAMFGDLARFQVRQIVTLAVFNLIIGFTIPNIDNFAHIGGLVAGVVTGMALAPRFGLAVWPGGARMVRRGTPVGWLAAGGVLLLIVAGALFIQGMERAAQSSCPF